MGEVPLLQRDRRRTLKPLNLNLEPEAETERFQLEQFLGIVAT